MPMLEIIQSAQEAPTVENKRAFVQDAIEIFHDVLSTPPDRLRIVFYPLAWEDSSAGLLESGESNDER